MIVDQITDWRRYAQLAELTQAFEFLEKHADGKGLGVERIDLDGSRLFVLPQSYVPKPLAEGRFEAHRRYVDVQYVTEGLELMGYAPLGALEGGTQYDEVKDVEFYHQPGRFTSVVASGGMFAVFYPEDGHMPGIRLVEPGSVRKLVVKVMLR